MNMENIATMINPALSGSGRPRRKEEAGDVCASTRAGR